MFDPFRPGKVQKPIFLTETDPTRIGQAGLLALERQFAIILLKMQERTERTHERAERMPTLIYTANVPCFHNINIIEIVNLVIFKILMKMNKIYRCELFGI